MRQRKVPDVPLERARPAETESIQILASGTDGAKHTSWLSPQERGLATRLPLLGSHPGLRDLAHSVADDCGRRIRGAARAAGPWAVGDIGAASAPESRPFSDTSPLKSSARSTLGNRHHPPSRIRELGSHRPSRQRDGRETAAPPATARLGLRPEQLPAGRRGLGNAIPWWTRDESAPVRQSARRSACSRAARVAATVRMQTQEEVTYG